MEKRNFKESERQLECTVEITAAQSSSSDQRRQSSLVSSKTPDIKRVLYNKQAQNWTYQTDPSPPTSWLTSVRYIQTRQKLKDTYFMKMEGWLVEMCEQDIFHLNLMARRLGMRNFEFAARRMVLEARVKMYATKQFCYNIKSEGSIADNSEMVIAHPWSAQPL
ncbi:unnamed protein product [Nezara viridula]|uniref:Uncharacterized protein n=1 Tax=Nezara viridula TaxID=85310 RepID=A0A9P0E7D3_NEZVI|nr:unnamed protein product [Nezara viridula]